VLLLRHFLPAAGGGSASVPGLIGQQSGACAERARRSNNQQPPAATNHQPPATLTSFLRCAVRALLCAVLGRCPATHAQALKINVDMLKLIQLGLTFTDAGE
jgi:hypothetical protein